jgi:hypothetical protein
MVGGAEKIRSKGPLQYMPVRNCATRSEAVMLKRGRQVGDPIPDFKK